MFKPPLPERITAWEEAAKSGVLPDWFRLPNGHIISKVAPGPQQIALRVETLQERPVYEVDLHRRDVTSVKGLEQELRAEATKWLIKEGALEENELLPDPQNSPEYYTT